MNELLRLIRDLPDDRAMEAARFLAGEDVTPDRPDNLLRRIGEQVPGLKAEALQAALLRATPEDVATLSRALMAYAALEGREAEVREAIEGAGEKALVLETVAVGSLLVAAYVAWRTGGLKKVIHSTEMSVAIDGTVTIRREEIHEYYSVGEILGQALQAVNPFGRSGDAAGPPADG